MLEKLIQLDTDLFLWFNGFHNAFFDQVMWVISGKMTWLPLYLFLLGVIIYKYKVKSIPIILGIVLSIVLADQLSVKAFKEVFERLRPSHNESIQHLIHNINNYKGGKFGFVSSHAANSFALAAYISFLYKRKWIGWSMFAWANIVSYSRIYLGVHYPGDILGGAILGFACGYFAYWVQALASRKIGTTKSSPHES